MKTQGLLDRRASRSICTGVFVLLMSSPSCKHAPMSPEGSLSGFADSSAKWLAPDRIPVCFTNWAEIQADPSFRTAALDIEYFVQKNFNRTNRVRFKWWHQACPKNLRDQFAIRIKLCKLNQMSDMFSGMSAIGPTKGSIFDFFREKYGENDDDIRSQATPCESVFAEDIPHTMIVNTDPNYLHSTAVHEFGHAIGLLHENLRLDSSLVCKAEKKYEENEDPAAKYYTDFDPTSVMHFCNWTEDLTHLDIQGINSLYPGAPVKPEPTPYSGCGQTACIRAYEHADYKGQAYQFWCQGKDTAPQVWNDKISSLKIPPRVRVRACIHSANSDTETGFFNMAKNHCRVFEGDTPWVGDDMNDKISFITIDRVKCR